MPKIDPHTESYRPGSRGINYRSRAVHQPARQGAARGLALVLLVHLRRPDHAHRRARYLGDPTKFRLIHGGSELFHVFHLHGGGDRWRFDPVADTTFDYADTGLNKHRRSSTSTSERLDSQATGPGESYTLEIEGGAGGVQQAAGDFLWHCHIAHHYLSGMWAFWRTYDTLQPDLMPLPDRAALPASVELGRPDRPHDARRHRHHEGQPRLLDPAAAARRRASGTTPRTPRSSTGRSTSRTRPSPST